MAIAIKMPQLGESVTEGTVGGWLKKVGDSVKKYEPLLEVISDKVDTEVTAPEAGILLSIEIEEGETVPVETVLAYLGTGDEDAASSQAAAPDVTPPVVAPPVATPPAVPAPAIAQETIEEEPARLTPVVARMVSEHNIDISQLSGTGRDGRITKRDIEAYLAKEEAKSVATPPSLPVKPVIAPPISPPVSVVPPAPPVPAPNVSSNKPQSAAVMPPRPRTSAPVLNVTQSAAYVTSVFEVDLNAVTRHLAANASDYQNRGINLTYLAYFVEVLAAALRQHPNINVSISNEGVQLHQEINIAVMHSTQTSVLAPIVKQADEKNLLGLARELNQLLNRANRNALLPTDMIGSTFTLNYNEQSQALWGTATMNASQSAMLSIGKVQKRVIVTPDDTIALRPMAYLSLTFNHQAIDEGVAEAFMGDVIQRLEQY